jgi:hypothetical protein
MCFSSLSASPVSEITYTDRFSSPFRKLVLLSVSSAHPEHSQSDMPQRYDQPKVENKFGFALHMLHKSSYEHNLWDI